MSLPQTPLTEGTAVSETPPLFTGGATSRQKKIEKHPFYHSIIVILLTNLRQCRGVM